MKKLFVSALTVAGLTLSLSALAQDTTTVVTPDQTTVVADTGYDTTTYPTTGWDPSALLLASSGLAAGSVALKGFLRKRD